MTQEITDQMWVLVLRGGVKVFINEAEFNGIKIALQTGSELLEVQGKLITKQSVLYLISAADLKKVDDERDRTRRGDWKCIHGRWIEKKYKECGCGRGY